MDGNAPDFNEIQISCLSEMANIGVGHAATAIAQLTSKPFQMSVPTVRSVELEAIPLMVGAVEELTVGIYMPVDGDVPGHMAFLFPWKSAQAFWRLLLGQAPESPDQIGELEASMMLEIGNIMNSSFLNAISEMCGLPIHATPPLLAVEMAAAILQAIVLEATATDSHALSIETKVSCEEEQAEGYFLFIPTLGGLKRLFSSLGLPEVA
ncbi:MAG: chemotaxis protein CheC [Fimbriimonadales bacterium]